MINTLDEALKQLERDLADPERRDVMKPSRPAPGTIVHWTDITELLDRGRVDKPVVLHLDGVPQANALRRRIYRYLDRKQLPRVRVRLLKTNIIIDMPSSATVVPDGVGT